MNNLIKNYIANLSIEDIKKFAKIKNINISESDALILYTYAKNNYQDLISGNDKLIIKELKEKINSNTFKDIYKIYLEYKIKYLR